ncbi:MAG: Protein translocase subunit SecE [Candidatus Ordinivivax streblomastigis]|jgi:preprotein translocase subunit SecE|uniref:Protein translocase subunit SecE n=1 Tax=Candidatus Ordinivivax streblomastigis TaxID=2540710 RepID=A0A5M8P0R7_9BACT|nr:MAG: Protein translocase subunit SecE [Candidatus Ordinivivax streblomastigis]MDR2843554.1 preprotein translocase subunit SecE [Candidatus Symbiothrix sp.]
MNKIISYIRESYNELVHKVSWPTSQELSSSTVVVMVASLVMAVVVFAIDTSFEWIVSNFYKIIFI